MYVSGFVVPVPADKKAEYTDIAQRFWEIAKDYGAILDVEAWEVSVPEGKVTDLRRAVDLKEGEKVVFSWVGWRDKATADASHETMMADERMKSFGEDMPFDGKRMIYAGFEPIMDLGSKDGKFGYVDGMVAAVPTANREAYLEHARTAADAFMRNGATRLVECWGVDVTDGKVTDFKRAVQARDDETVVFSWIEWPDQATSEKGMAALMEDPAMANMEMPFDGQRMVFGGFEPIVNERA